MSKNPGKRFEEDIKASANNQGLFILRLNDSSLSWQHEKTSRFTAENPYDFIMFCQPNLFCLELKKLEHYVDPSFYYYFFICYFLLFSIEALIKLSNSGCGLVGRDLNSG